jgi:hypothetical protein
LLNRGGREGEAAAYPGREAEWDRSHFISVPLRQKGMCAMEFEWWYFVLMILVGLGLVGILLFLRNKRTDEE